MPKRIPTPPPGDDEPRYLTVVHPYAINGYCNMELPKDRQDFARWVACCIDKDAFFAVFHKPSARDMVIIEINRDYQHFDRILGEHRWSEILRNPTKEEKERATQVFYCAYNTGRIVQKNGWKRIYVEEAWFKTWSPNNSLIAWPYPATHFCDVPVEDQTNHPICRPLPGAVKPPPPEVIAAPQPVVGSAAWINKKQGGRSLTPAATAAKTNVAWSKGAPKVQTASTKANSTTNGSVKKTVNIPQGPATGVRMPAIGGGPVTVKSTNVWRNGQRSINSPAPVVVNWEESPSASGHNTPAARAISPAAPINQPPAAPPGLPAKSAWGNSAISTPLHPPGLAVPADRVVPVSDKGSVPSVPDRATISSAISWGSIGASASSPDSESPATRTESSDDPYKVHVQFSETMEEEFYGMKIRENDDSDLAELDSVAPGAWDGSMGNPTWDATASHWDDVAPDAESLWNQEKEPEKPLLCNAHGIICKKGICAEYAKQVRLAKRAKEAEEREKDAANKKNKGRKGKGRPADKGARGTGSTPPKPAQNNAFRGPGAPVKTNWRGAPRAIVSADAIEQREAVHTEPVGWGNSDDDEPNVAAVTANLASESASSVSWGMSEASYDPWGTSAQPAKKADAPRNKKQPQQKKPPQTKASSSWADQVEAASAAGGDDGFSVVGSKRGGRAPSASRSSASGWGAKNAPKSSTSGWGTVSDMPW